MNTNLTEQDKALAIVGYILPFLFFVPLLGENKGNDYVKFHANQQLNLLLYWVVGQLALWILAFLLIGFLLMPFYILAGLALTVIGALSASKGETKPLPLIGKFKLLS